MFEVMVAITPLDLGIEVQSSKMVFPINLYRGGETIEEMRAALGDIIGELKDLVISVTTEEGKEIIHKLFFIIVSDLKAGWQLFGLGAKDCMFCNCSSVSGRSEPPSTYNTFSRLFEAENVLFPSLGIEGNVLHLLKLLLIIKICFSVLYLYYSHANASCGSVSFNSCCQSKRI